MLGPAARELLLGAEAAQLQHRSAVLAWLRQCQVLVCLWQGWCCAMPAPPRHEGSVTVELCPRDVPAWISPSSGTSVPCLVFQDRMALRFQGAVTLQKNTALQTLLCHLHPEQIRTSSSLCQTHPNHPRSPVCLRPLVPPCACSPETFMHGSSTRDFTRSYYLYNLFKLDYGAFFIACLSILCFIVCCSDWF